MIGTLAPAAVALALVAPIAGGPATALGNGYQNPGYVVSRNGVLVWAEYWGQAVWRMHVP